MTQKLINIEITNENVCCKYCTESLFLNMKKMTILNILHLLVRMLNRIEDDKEEKEYKISTNFIRKPTGFFFTITVLKAYSNVTLTKIH